MYYENFEKLCRIKGIRPGSISKATGITTATITSWKQGKYTPKLEKLQTIADFFGVPLSVLISGEEPEKVSGAEQPSPSYYLNERTAAIAQQVFDDPSLQLLFDAAKGCTQEDIAMAAQMLRKFKKGNQNG